MLGDKEVYGIFNCTIDDKNRMIIPAKTGIEVGEEVLIYSENGSRYIANKIAYLNRLKNILERIEDPTSVEQLRNDIELRDYICDSIIKEAKADKQHRILVTDVYQPKGKAKVQGMGRVLKLL